MLWSSDIAISNIETISNWTAELENGEKGKYGKAESGLRVRVNMGSFPTSFAC
jgi:hypothetical protein